MRIELGGGPGGYIHVTVASATSGNIILMVNKAANQKDAVLTWLGGGPTYQAVRSLSVLFTGSNADITDPMNPMLLNTTDTNALLTPELYFYLVGDGSVADPLPGDHAYAPCPPVITSITNLTTGATGEGYDNDNIRIDGTCFFDNQPLKNLVTFNDLRATVTAATATSLTVTVPPRVTTGPVRVMVNGLTSNELPFTVVVPTAPTVTFQDISSMFFYDTTQQLYVADRGSNDRVYRLDFSTNPPGVVATAAGLNEVIMSNGRDSLGNLFYVSTVESCTNNGITRRLAADDITVQTNWETVGCTNCFSPTCGVPSQALQPIWMKAIAVHSSESNVIYGSVAHQGCTSLCTGCAAGCAVSQIHAVWRIPDNLPYDRDYGNSQPSFPFAFPTGGGVPLSGSDFDTAGNLYVTNGSELRMITPAQVITVVGGGFASLAGIDVKDIAGTTYILAADRGAGRVYLINIQTGMGKIIAEGLNSPRAVAFAKDPGGRLVYYVAEATRVIRLPDSRIKFPDKLKRDGRLLISKLPEDPDGYPMAPFQTLNGQIDIEFELDPPPTTPVTFQVRAFDPPADIVYAPDQANNKGAIFMSSTATIGTNGKLTTPLTLTFTSQYSGDNYIIEISDTPFGSPEIVARTGTLTAYKRIYVEADRMYKEGSFLNVNFVGPGNVVTVRDVSDFNLGGGDPVLLFDSANLTGETAIVAPGGVNITTREITLDRTLTGTYIAGDAAGGNWAGLVKTVPGTFDMPYYQMLYDGLEEDAFIEYRQLTKDNNVVPHGFFPGGDPQLDTFGAAYFGNPGKSNYIHVTHADRVTSGDVTLLGSTNPNQNDTVIFEGTTRATQTINPTGALSEVLDHEITHQWKVNNGPPGVGHDNNPALEGGPTNKCIMHFTRDWQDDDTDLDIIGGVGGAGPDIYGVRDGLDGLFF